VGLGYLVFTLALWVGATHVLSALTIRKTGEERIDVHDLLLDKDFKVFRQNFLFFLILFIGAYLSLASIAAIPDLRVEKGSVPQRFSAKTLRENMTKVGLTTTADKDAPNPLALVDSLLYPGLFTAPPAAAAQPKASFTPVRDTTGPVRSRPAQPDTTAARTPQTSTADTTRTAGTGAVGDTVGSTAGGTTPGNPPASTMASRPDTTTGARTDSAPTRAVNPAIPPRHVAELRAQVSELRMLWTSETVRLDSTRRTLTARWNSNMNRAEAAYADADTTRRLREQRAYFYRLQHWFVEGQADLQSEYDHAHVTLRRLERSIQGWSTEMVGYLTSPGPDTTQFQALLRQAVRLRSADWLVPQPLPATRREVPDRAEGLGPFRYVIGWLLKTDSMPLTLIVGMLGFGLLGAAASTFVREQTKRERREARRRRRIQKKLQSRGIDADPAAESRAPGDNSQPLHTMQPLVLNLASVVIRGGSAAIVVFLGIMGGLSVLTQEADPNPYALLFTCLVGAVFSEKVWEWAEERFGLNLGRDRDEEDDEDGEPGEGGVNGNNGGNAGNGGGGDAGNGGGGNGGGGQGGGDSNGGDAADVIPKPPKSA
jgi:uncharacterized membrane protein YgcG